MRRSPQGIIVGGHHDHFLIIDQAGTDYVVGVRSHTGDFLSVYLRSDDMEKLIKFLSRKPDQA